MARQPQTINEEAGLGPNWVPLDGPPIIPGQMVGAPPASDFSPTNPKYLQGTIAPNFQHDSSFVDTGDKTAHVPKFDLMPLGPQQNAITSTQLSSAVKSVIESLPASPAEPDVESIGVNQQTGATYTANVSDNDKLIVLEDNAGGTLILPGPVTTGGPDFIGDGPGSNASGTTTSVTTPSQTATSNDLGLFISSNANVGTPTLGGSWSFLDDISGNLVAVQLVPQGNTVSGSATLSGASYWASTLNLFTFYGNSVPTYVQKKVIISGSLPGSASGTFTSNVSKGNEIWLVTVAHTTLSGPGFLVSDSQGNSYTQINSSFNGTPDPANGNVSWYVFLHKATAGASGSLTITVVGNGNTGAGTIAAYEMSAQSTPIVTTGSVLPKGWFAFVENTGSGTFSIKSTANIDGIQQTVTLNPNQGMLIVSDGLSYWTSRGGGGSTDIDFYQTVQRASVSKPQESRLNFSSSFIVTDNPGNSSTDIGFSGLMPVMTVNGIGVATDKEVDVNGAKDFATAWGVNINGVTDGG